MPTKKAAKKKIQASAPSTSFFDYLRFGESYTSLIFGIIAVIIATIVLLSFIHGKQSPKPEQQTNQSIQITGDLPLSPQEPTSAQILTATSTARATDMPKPTTVDKSPTATPTKAQPTKALQKPKEKPMTGKTYTVVAGDSLWSIAEKTYNDGDQWVAIAKANKLAHPSDIHVGNKLILPKLSIKPTEKPAQKPTKMSKPQPTQTMNQAEKITGTTYTIKAGDDLWDIAERAYGDGYGWTKIAKANNITNPSLIHVGNVLKIPRK